VNRPATAQRHDQPDSRGDDSEQPGRQEPVASDGALSAGPLALAIPSRHSSLASLLGSSGCGRHYAS
jgi:hypothetical protein